MYNAPDFFSFVVDAHYYSDATAFFFIRRNNSFCIKGSWGSVKLFLLFSYQQNITRYFDNAKHFGEGKEVWEHVFFRRYWLFLLQL